MTRRKTLFAALWPQEIQLAHLLGDEHAHRVLGRHGKHAESSDDADRSVFLSLSLPRHSHVYPRSICRGNASRRHIRRRAFAVVDDDGSCAFQDGVRRMCRDARNDGPPLRRGTTVANSLGQTKDRTDPSGLRFSCQVQRPRTQPRWRRRYFFRPSMRRVQEVASRAEPAPLRSSAWRPDVVGISVVRSVRKGLDSLRMSLQSSRHLSTRTIA